MPIAAPARKKSKLEKKVRISLTPWLTRSGGGLFVAILRACADYQPGVRRIRNAHPNVPQSPAVGGLRNIAEGVTRADILGDCAAHIGHFGRSCREERLAAAHFGHTFEETGRAIRIVL